MTASAPLCRRCVTMWPLVVTVSALLLWRPAAADAEADRLMEKLASGRPPRAVVDKLETAFLHTLGMKRRPSARPAVPDYLSEVYAQVATTTRELNTLDLNLPGHMTGSANTVRSFVHSGECERRWDGRLGPGRARRPWRRGGARGAPGRQLPVELLPLSAALAGP